MGAHVIIGWGLGVRGRRVACGTWCECWRLAACPQAKRLGGRDYVRLGGRGWGRRQEAGGKGGDGRVFGLLEAEKCPLKRFEAATTGVLQRFLKYIEYRRNEKRSFPSSFSFLSPPAT